MFLWQVRVNEWTSMIDQHQTFASCWEGVTSHIASCKEILEENQSDKGDKQTIALRLDKLLVSLCRFLNNNYLKSGSSPFNDLFSEG